ncbi:hypothetical protein DFH08DRAFT_1088893 [Mycena albidolilacea]|uniref:Uncharacterized protein n=1 Tax=Mycena albidolilacea TaxID=1033008 RepID=A0AAD7EA69_9AGAR|nr:hypothetical protein DFH08DRAFT_1088893 [Mycena albidolilacea]
MSATFCSKPVSLSVNPASEKSLVTLDWVLANGIAAPRSAASGVLTLPSGGSICSMHIKASICSDLPYDLVLGRDWLFFCRETLPHSSFTLSPALFTLEIHLISRQSRHHLPSSTARSMSTAATVTSNLSCRAVPVFVMTR